jgi:type IX secretion system PorP/SprF family membrane protein
LKSLTPRFLILLVAGLQAALPATAQEVVFSHLLSAPMYANPAFAGTFGAYHAGMAVRSPFTAVANVGHTAYVEGDAFLSSWNSGIGVYAMNDRFAGGVFQTTSFGLAYAYAFRLSESMEVRPALQAVFHLHQRNPQSWLFPDVAGSGGAVAYPAGESSESRVDFAAGLLFSHPAFQSGIAVQHLGAAAAPSSWVYGAPSIKLTVHARFPLTLAGSGDLQPLREWMALENVVLSPHATYVRQGDFTYLIAGAALRSGGLAAGVALRTPLQNATYAAVVSLGVESRSLTAGYVFDFLAAGGDLRGWNSGSHELFLHYSFGAVDDPPQRRTGKRRRPLNPACGCPY